MVLASVVAFACALAWSLRSTLRPERVALGTGASRSGEVARPAEPSAFAVDGPESLERVDAIDERIPIRPQRSGASAGPIENALAVDGRVLLPPGLPADEALAIVATGAPFEDGERTRRSAVAADGSFRALFSERTRTGRIALESRYLICDELACVRVRELDEEPVFEPTLGGLVRGRVVLPPLRANEAASWDEIRVSAGYASDARSTTCGDGGRFELGGVGGKTALCVSTERWIAPRPVTVEVSAGSVVEVEIPLERGVVVAGSVRDERGVALEGVWLTAKRRIYGLQKPCGSPARSDADGRFELRALEAGELRLFAWVDGHAHGERSLGDLREGDVLVGLVLTLDSGERIAGRVRWPDGRPAAGASVSLHQPEPRSSSSSSGAPVELAHRADAEGHFEFEGLLGGPCELVARARPDEPGEGTHALYPEIWQARCPRVALGTHDVELELEAGARLRGRVVDDRGAPVARFRVLAQPRWGDAEGTASVSMAFASADGRFELRGLVAGHWNVSASAREHVRSKALHFDLPNENEIELVVPRTSRLSGRVVGPDGEAVAGANVLRVELGPGDPPGRFETRVASSSADGRFSIDRAESGRFEFYARARGYLPSESLALELAPGDELAVELRLARGTTRTR